MYSYCVIVKQHFLHQICIMPSTMEWNYIILQYRMIMKVTMRPSNGAMPCAVSVAQSTCNRGNIHLREYVEANSNGVLVTF